MNVYEIYSHHHKYRRTIKVRSREAAKKRLRKGEYLLFIHRIGK